MKNFKSYNENWGSLIPSSESNDFEVGDVCIYLKNGNLAKEIVDYETIDPKPIRTLMSPDYLNKKCKIISVNKKVFDIITTYKIQFLHNGKITICKAKQLKKVDNKDSDVDYSRISKEEQYSNNSINLLRKSKSDIDLKLEIYSETKEGKINWKRISYLDRTIVSYKATIPVPKTKSNLKLEIQMVGKEWILKIYYEREFSGTVLVRRINNVLLLANELAKRGITLSQEKDDTVTIKNSKDDEYDDRKGLPDSANK